MKFIKRDLLTLLIGLFLLASCKSANTIGLDIDPSEAVVGDLVDTLVVKSRTLAEEPSQTYNNSGKSGLARYPLGFMQDPLFGPTEASLAVSVSLPNESFGFGKDPVLDSAVLVLGYSRPSGLNADGTTSGLYTQFYGDTTNSVYSIDVRQLDNNIATASSFLSNKEWAATSPVIGNYTGKIKPNTYLSVTDIIASGPDTVKKVEPQIRIKLDNTVISDEILALDSAALKYNERFADLFRGLKININKASSTGPGGIMFFDFSSPSKLELYYKRPNATTATNTDTVHVDLPINVGNNPVAATIKRDYTGTPIETQLNNPSVQYPVTYLQGLNGLKNKISFPGISNLKAKLGKVVINKAELIVDVSSGTDVNPFVPAPRLALYRYDVAERRQNIPDNNPYNYSTNPTGDTRAFLSPEQFGGFYDAVNKRYIFIVTLYVQDLLDGKTQDYGTFLSTTASSEHSIAPPLTSASRSVIGAAGNASNKLKLNIYYTKIK